MPIQQTGKTVAGYRLLVTLASLVIIIAGLKAVGSILLPVLVAVFLMIMCLPPIALLKRLRLPAWAATILVFCGVLCAFSLVSAILGSSVQNFIRNLPRYEAMVGAQLEEPLKLFERFGVDIPATTLREYINFDHIMSIATVTVTALGAMLKNMVFVLITVVFLMGEVTGFSQKVRAAIGDPDADLDRFSNVVKDLNGYLMIKTMTSLATGLLAGTLVFLAGVDDPFLWGLIAFLANFIPTLGSIIAGIPPVLLAFVQFGWERAIVVLAGYLLINMVIGNFIDPKLMGRKMGLSTLVVFLSMVFWGWVWGPVGMLLSVPMTMLIKIALDHSEDLRWLAVMLGPAKAREKTGKSIMEKMTEKMESR